VSAAWTRTVLRATVRQRNQEPVAPDAQPRDSRRPHPRACLWLGLLLQLCSIRQDARPGLCGWRQRSTARGAGFWECNHDGDGRAGRVYIDNYLKTGAPHKRPYACRWRTRTLSHYERHSRGASSLPSEAAGPFLGPQELSASGTKMNFPPSSRSSCEQMSATTCSASS